MSRDRPLELGESVFLIQPAGNPPWQMGGVVVAVGAEEFTLSLESAFDTAPGHFVFVITEGQARLASTGYALPSSERRVTCRLLSPWREIATDRRAASRYTTALEAFITASSGEYAKGTVVNVSEGGCAVVTTLSLPGNEFEVLIEFKPYSARVPCARVGTSLAATAIEEPPHGSNQRTPLVSHLRFRSVNGAQKAFLRLLLARHAESWA